MLDALIIARCLGVYVVLKIGEGETINKIEEGNIIYKTSEVKTTHKISEGKTIHQLLYLSIMKNVL